MLKNILETDRVKSPVIKLQSCEEKLRKYSKTKVLGQKQNRAFFMDHPVYVGRYLARRIDSHKHTESTDTLTQLTTRTLI